MKNTLKINHADRIIVMDRTFAKLAENTMSAEYAHLQQVRRDYPKYKVIQRQIKKNSNKETYNGLTYEVIGWDLNSSTFDGDEIEYPDFEVLTEQLDYLIGSSDYASDIKSNYRGALLTRVKSLTVGLNKSIFTTAQTPYIRPLVLLHFFI